MIAAAIASITLLAGLALVLWTRALPSTRKYFRHAGFGLQAWHGYVYGRWTERYIRMLFALPNDSSTPTAGAMWLADHYHGKILTHGNARDIVTLDCKIPLQDLEQIVPYPTARKILLDASPDIVAYECPCRHARPVHCEPTQVCMVIGKPMTDFVLEHQPESSRRLTREEALALLEAERGRGHLHSAWFKDAMMGRFYCICNCCKCCCGGIAQMADHGVPMVASSGYVAEIDAALCANCGECVEVCPFQALSRTEAGAVRDWDRCLGCGVCEAKCATGAIAMTRDERKGIPLDVRALANAGPPASTRAR
jgi:formate hydrogenlyase subunit 6/NADH:ubiquinone oxidoreductase subunit I